MDTKRTCVQVSRLWPKYLTRKWGSPVTRSSPNTVIIRVLWLVRAGQVARETSHGETVVGKYMVMHEVSPLPGWTTIQQIGVEEMLEITGRANHFGRRVAWEEWIWEIKNKHRGKKIKVCFTERLGKEWKEEKTDKRETLLKLQQRRNHC